MNEQFVHRFKFTFGLRNLIECCPADTSSLVSFGSAHLSSSLSTCWRTSFTLTIHLTSFEINVIARTVDEVWRLQISWCQGNLKEDNFEKFTNRFPVKNETVGQDVASIREIFTSKRFVIGQSTCEVATYANEKPSSSVNEAAHVIHCRLVLFSKNAQISKYFQADAADVAQHLELIASISLW